MFREPQDLGMSDLTRSIHGRTQTIYKSHCLTVHGYTTHISTYGNVTSV